MKEAKLSCMGGLECLALGNGQLPSAFRDRDARILDTQNTANQRPA